MGRAVLKGLKQNFNLVKKKNKKFSWTSYKNRQMSPTESTAVMGDL